MIIFSWIIPVRNEAESLPKLFGEIGSVPLKNFEIIVIDDASNDVSYKVLRGIAAGFPMLKIIRFKTQRGKWAALEAGFGKSRGEIIITCDSDLQDDPREVLKLLKKFNAGYDLVSGWRRRRKDTAYKVLISKAGNLLVSLVYKYKFHDLNSPFKIYKRQVFESIPSHGSLLRFATLFAVLSGFKVAEVPVVHRPRLYGNSKFGLIKYIRILYDLVLVLMLFRGSGRLTRKIN